MSLQTKEKFAQELAQDEANLNLARAALLISEYLNQSDDDVAYYLTLLDDMAEALRPSIRAATTELGIIGALNCYLFEELGFYGNAEDYYNPNNSFLDKVLDLKTGIPILLSVVYLELGWRLDLPLYGIGLPGHFIVSYGPAAKELIYLDVFNQGQILSEDDCLDLCQMPRDQRFAFRQAYLAPVVKRAILFRMLLNLKQIYLQQEAWELAHRTIDLMLIVRPDQVEEYRDRGVVAARLNRLREAIFDFRRYLYLIPDAPDANWLKQHLEMMEEKLSRLN
jgi:regulator of sirC expression with transglutaminase-like and TPR domain